VSEARPVPLPVRVRIAPSPTGFFHVGNARTALFNWLFARSRGGTFVWRVEDTDRARFVPTAVEDVAESLRWLGLEPDEGPIDGGPYGPYYQSERLALYAGYAEALLADGHAYRCYCTPERLEEVRQRRAAAGQKVGYDRRCRGLSAAERAAAEAAGTPSVLRLSMPLAGETVITDVIRGEIRFAAGELEDVVLVKSDGFPTYHFAVVVDDHLMEISHVLRADEWIPSTPYQIRLYEALGWEAPVWAHVPMVLNPDGRGKLSKRKTVDEEGQPLEQMTQVREFRAAGYLPEAMFNYLALLGWSFSADEDLFSREAAVERFRLEDVKPSPAAWNPDKLLWMNGVYLRALTPGELAARLLPFLRAAGLPADEDDARAVAPLVQERITTLSEAVDLVAFLWREVAPSAEDLVPKKMDGAGASALLAAAEERLAALGDWAPGPIEEALRALAEAHGLKAGPAFQPVRVAATGSRVSPPLFESLELLGRDRTLARLAAARVTLAGLEEPA
jgi:glutamyl-tRNA synthetase